MKSAQVFATVIFLTLTATTVMSHATTVDDRVGGYKCVLKPGTLTFAGGANSEARRSFTDFASINVYFAQNLLSGLLKPIAKNALEFQLVDTLVTVAKTPQADHMSSDTMYPTKQQTMLFDEHSKQIKTERDLPAAGAITNIYSHTFENSKNGATTKFFVQIIEEQIIDHATTKEATLSFEYEAPAALAQPGHDQISGAVTADLVCEDQL